MFKVIVIHEFCAGYNRQSGPYDCEANESGYILLPDFPDAVQFDVYAPFFEEAETGPWYLLKFVSRREAKQARRTIAVVYRNSDLICQLLPSKPMRFTFPLPAEGQDLWLLGGGEGSPYAILRADIGPHYELR